MSMEPSLKEGRDDFRNPFFKGKEGWVGFRKNPFF